MVKEKEDRDVESINAMADALQELNKNIEPIYHKVAEEKARLTGYFQGVEQVMKIIAARMQHLREQANEPGKKEQEIVNEQTPQVPVKVPEKPAEVKEIIEFQQEKK